MKGSSEFDSLLQTAESPELGPGPRAGVLSVAELNATLDRVLAETQLAGARADLVRALVLLWHDHLEPAHVLAQAVPDRDGSYVHGILHRREPDYSNAKYWFQRVGSHPCYRRLAVEAAALLQDQAGAALAGTFLRNQLWDAVGFVDACEAAARQTSGQATARRLREVQALEFHILLEHLCSAPGGAASQ